MVLPYVPTDDWQRTTVNKRALPSGCSRHIEAKLESSKPLLDMVELSSDAFLFRPEKFQRDHGRVVRFQELGALVKGAALPAHTLLAFDAGVLAAEDRAPLASGGGCAAASCLRS